MLLQPLASAAGAHPLSGTIAEYVWLLPILPLVGFVVNGLLSLFSAYHAGPSDPYTSHHTSAAHDADVAEAHAAQRAEHAMPTGSDSHLTARHTYAAVSTVVGPLVVILSFGLALWMFIAMLNAGASMHEPFVKRFFAWMPVGDLRIDWAFQLDQLSMMMVLIITGVGSLIHIFSVGYMRDDPGYPRYFAYLNLFVALMLVLVLGASYPVMFVGWEGVGLASYLLIGFWFSDKANADAGKKAFIVNRVGDVGFLIAMFLIWANIGTLDFTGVAAQASVFHMGGVVVTAICLFFLLGCTGKSAQIPLYIWLPDAMAGPTPVSALIHAATMVTAGVYLIARSSFLFSLAPTAELTVAVIGVVTAFFAATIGLKQWDIKKVLAYSTISQLGYMFVAVGVGAYVSGMFHLMTHAFFKALLFLGSGAVIHAMHEAYHHTGSHADAQDMRNMGGLKKFMPVTWVLMWIATLAISGIPPFSGFFSKDEILGSVFARAHESTLASAHWLGIPGSALLYAVYVIGLAGAFLTAIYMTRLMLYTFHGPNRTGAKAQEHLHETSPVMLWPLIILGALSLVGGWINIPEFASAIGPVGLLDHWLEPVIGAASLRVTNGVAPEVAPSTEYMLVGLAVLIAIAGIVLAVVLLKPAKLVPKAEAAPDTGVGALLANKYYVDEAVEAGIVTPVVEGSRNILWRVIDSGIIDGLFVNGSAWFMKGFAWVGSQIQSGQVGTYAWAIVIGVLAVLGVFTLR
ncbi:MAG TPA: NADH-quinone oxidoreductase subunit L [Gemmatimonadaceae bacterium]|nr:NADH-quinone oxidoreductase subunit L [Gemmatimonadaceae bacterium]